MLAEGVTLSGVIFFDEDYEQMWLWRISKMSAEGARHIYANLSGKRTEFGK